MRRFDALNEVAKVGKQGNGPLFMVLRPEFPARDQNRSQIEIHVTVANFPSLPDPHATVGEELDHIRRTRGQSLRGLTQRLKQCAELDMSWQFNDGLWLLPPLEPGRGVIEENSTVASVAEQNLQSLQFDVVTSRGQRDTTLPLPFVNLSESDGLDWHPLEIRREADNRHAPPVIGLGFQGRLDGFEPVLPKFLESNVPILFSVQPFGLGSQLRQPPLGDGHVIRLERALNLLARDFDKGEIYFVRVPIQALGNLFEILRLLGGFTHSQSIGLLKRVTS